MSKTRHGRHPHTAVYEPQLSERARLKQAADEAFDAKQCAFDDWHAVRQDRNQIRRDLNRCNSKIAAAERQLKNEQEQKEKAIARINHDIRTKQRELKKYRKQCFGSFRQMDALKADGDKEAIFARWEGYDLNELCLNLEVELQNLEAELGRLKGFGGLLPAQTTLSELHRERQDLTERMRQALDACQAMEEIFHEKEAAFQAAQQTYLSFA